MNTAFFTAASVCLALFASHASAEITGNDLLRECRSTDALQKVHCLGYVAGVLDGAVISSLGAQMFCLPQGVNVGQVADIMSKSLDATPESRHEAARLLIMLEMIKRFPCKKQSS
jgi:hypothetical protein